MVLGQLDISLQNDEMGLQAHSLNKKCDQPIPLPVFLGVGEGFLLIF